MKNPKTIQCPLCKEWRLVDYRQVWLIKKNKITARCFKCSRPKKGEINSGCFKKGCVVSEEIRKKMSLASKGKKKPPRTKEHRENLGKANKGKTTGEKNAMKRLEVRKKVSESQRGEKGHNWKGGRKSITLILRDCYKYREWRKAVFIRDNWICVFCKKGGERLEVDHFPIQMALIIDKLIKEKGIDDIINKALEYEPLWDIKNGRTICKECHKKTDTYGWKGVICKSINQ